MKYEKTHLENHDYLEKKSVLDQFLTAVEIFVKNVRKLILVNNCKLFVNENFVNNQKERKRRKIKRNLKKL